MKVARILIFAAIMTVAMGQVTQGSLREPSPVDKCIHDCILDGKFAHTCQIRCYCKIECKTEPKPDYCEVCSMLKKSEAKFADN